jgi:hypothetical protein
LGIVTSGIEALFNSGAEILAGASLEAIMSKDNRCSQMQMKSLELWIEREEPGRDATSSREKNCLLLLSCFPIRGGVVGKARGHFACCFYNKV